jgi:excisionase family DNA binding protein
MAAIELITKEDLRIFKSELIHEIKSLLKPDDLGGKKYLKTHQVCKLLSLSQSTLQTLRINGTIGFTKIGGILYYRTEDIERLLEDNRRG